MPGVGGCSLVSEYVISWRLQGLECRQVGVRGQALGVSAVSCSWQLCTVWLLSVGCFSWCQPRSACTHAPQVTHAAIAAAAQGDVPVDYATDVSLAAQSQVSSIPSYDCWNCASSWSSGTGSYGYSSSSSGRPRG